MQANQPGYLLRWRLVGFHFPMGEICSIWHAPLEKNKPAVGQTPNGQVGLLDALLSHAFYLDVASLIRTPRLIQIFELVFTPFESILDVLCPVSLFSAIASPPVVRLCVSSFYRTIL